MFTHCPIEYLGETGALHHYSCQKCSDCSLEELTDNRTHVIDFECENCGGPVGGCTDGFNEQVEPLELDDPLNLAGGKTRRCGHGRRPLLNTNGCDFKPGPFVSAQLRGVAEYADAKGQKRRARLFVIQQRQLMRTVYLGVQTSDLEQATLKCVLVDVNGCCHHVKLDGMGPLFHVITDGK
jgi:hypothetical protein